MPSLSEAEVVAFGTKKVVEPLKKPNQNGFGSQWNKITAQAACQSLGWGNPKKRNVVRLLSSDTRQAIKLKNRQSEIAALFQKSIEINFPGLIGLGFYLSVKNSLFSLERSFYSRFRPSSVA